MKNTDTLQLDIAVDTLESFVICLALGTLKSIREDILRSEVGIWTLGRPCFWHKLEVEKLVSPEVLKVLQTADEIDAMLELGGADKTKAMLDRLIAKLESSLRKVDKQSWYACWGGGKDNF